MKLKERRIGLNDFLVVIRKFYFLIIAGALVLGGAGWLTASRSVEENYTASSMVYVQTVSTDMDIGTSSTETALARALAASCVTVMKNDALVKNVRRYFAERRADSPEENWEESWKDSYPPQPVGKGLLVGPLVGRGDGDDRGKGQLVVEPVGA